MLNQFKVPILLSVVLIILAGILGSPEAAFKVTVLAMLEISLSVDNAVVNATILKGWDHKWRRIFLVFGLPVAVFGMRLVFPLLIVGLSAGMMSWNILTAFGLWDVLQLAISSPTQYAATLTASHEVIVAFGASFLMLVFFKYFMDEEKDVHWVKFLEQPLGSLSKLEEAFTLLIVVFLSSFAHAPTAFILAGIYGIVCHVIVDKLGSLGGASGVVRQGLGGFLYLEVLDSSFSFDGVIGAFALTNNIFIIAVGLGIGALFVRELTIYLVEKNVPDKYKYLEHGAFWAIGILAVIMFSSLMYEVPEVVTGLLGASVLGLSVWSSVKDKKRDKLTATAAV